MTMLLVRHARAGRRQTWTGDDRLRPLSPRGQQQAKNLAVLLPDLLGQPEPPVSILTSPWVRCVQTLSPLAAALGVEVVEEPTLGEGNADAALELIAALVDRPAVLCTHGDVIEATLGWLQRSGVDLGRRPTWPKGSTWLLSARSGRYDVARYIEPPL